MTIIQLFIDSVLGFFTSFANSLPGAISEGKEEHGNIGKLLGTIRNDVAADVGKTDSLDVAIRHHAHVQVERILTYPHVTEKIEKGELLVKRAYYDVKTGKVTID